MAMVYTDTTTISRALLAKFQDYFTANWTMFVKQYSQWNTMMPSKTKVHTFDSYGNLAEAEQMTDGADFPLNKITQAYETSCTILPFGTGLGITYQAEKYAGGVSNLIDKIKVAGTAKSMLTKLEKNAIAIWDNAFTTNLADGVPACSASHPCFDLVGGTGTLWNNLATGALAYSTLEAGMKKFAQFLDGRGEPVPAVCDTIKTHALNQFALTKLFDSQYVPLDNQLVQNPLPKLKAVFSNYLTSTTAWFLEDTSSDRPHGISMYLENTPSPENDVVRDQNNRGYKATSAFFMGSCMVENPGLVGSTGL